MNTVPRYEQSLRAMYGLRRFGIKLGLETIGGLLSAMGGPHQRYRSVHVAGTNGKGSIAATVASILTAAGYRTGLYTSPHLVRFNERIRIDGVCISDEEVVQDYERLWSVHRGKREPTFFEFATAMALTAFARREVDWAVVETGMGGRLDATNVIRPAVSVISNISLEHREYLGDTIRQIASEKAGIVKPGTPVVTGVRQPAAREAIASAAAACKAPLYRLGSSFRFRRAPSGDFHYYRKSTRWRHLRPSLQGRFQLENAALAVAVCDLLRRRGARRIDEDIVRRGLAGTRWPGRLQRVSDRPLVLLDGAHNLQAARSLAEYLRTEVHPRETTLVVGILNDKPYAEMLKIMLPTCRRAILTRARTERALPPDRLDAVARSRVEEVRIIPDVGKAVAEAIDGAGQEGAVCIAGSLYVVGEAMEWLASHPLGGRRFSLDFPEHID
ncbi:MAG: bifunctional folylpolyglutamate synthase/dihydrofolate synthase [Desulfobacteraceae bacterium]|nr:bifunctional folylpolyglutamate synthase/dihydrofolate synthase [Desulfobacteraceae bacterium]